MTPDYEAWRPALAAYYRAIGSDGCAQLAEMATLTRFDCETIDGLVAAVEAAPRIKRKVAA